MSDISEEEEYDTLTRKSSELVNKLMLDNTYIHPVAWIHAFFCGLMVSAKLIDMTHEEFTAMVISWLDNSKGILK